MKQTVLANAFLVLGALMSPTLAGEKAMDHSTMESGDVREARAPAVIHAIDADKGVVNVTHDPIPEIGWPQMKMDLPVTRRVDLSTVEPGSKVVLTLKKGMDNRFRVIAIEAAE